MLLRAAAVAAVVEFALVVEPVQAQVTTQVIAISGDPAPDGNGSFASFLGVPALNEAGQVAFIASLSATNGGSVDDTGIFRGSAGAVMQIAAKIRRHPTAAAVCAT